MAASHGRLCWNSVYICMSPPCYEYEECGGSLLQSKTWYKWETKRISYCCFCLSPRANIWLGLHPYDQWPPTTIEGALTNTSYLFIYKQSWNSYWLNNCMKCIIILGLIQSCWSIISWLFFCGNFSTNCQTACLSRQCFIQHLGLFSWLQSHHCFGSTPLSRVHALQPQLVYITPFTFPSQSLLLAEKKRKVRFVFPLSSYVVSVRPLTHSTTLTIQFEMYPLWQYHC